MITCWLKVGEMPICKASLQKLIAGKNEDHGTKKSSNDEFAAIYPWNLK
jgi:hypothetical protein